jgi:hypothetical protein
MSLQYDEVRHWITTSADLPDLLELRTILNHTIEIKRLEHLSSVREQIDAIARQSGFASAAELSATLLRTSGSPARPENLQHLMPDSRKPFMNPFDPNTELYALSERRDKRPHWPEWAKQLASEGWSKAEFHWKRIPDALRARGREPTYDHAERYQLLRQRAQSL